MELIIFALVVGVGGLPLAALIVAAAAFSQTRGLRTQLAAANAELENIRAEWRAHPDVLDLRWLIYSHHEQWDACLDIASAIVKMAPDRVWRWVHKAYALRRATGGGIEKPNRYWKKLPSCFQTIV